LQVAGVAVVYEVTVSKTKDDAKAAATAAEKAQLRAVIVEVKDTLRETVRAHDARGETHPDVPRQPRPNASCPRRLRAWRRCRRG
jgi:hypothetical protein